MLGSSFAPRHCAGCISDFYHIAGGLEQNLWLRNPASPAPWAGLRLALAALDGAGGEQRAVVGEHQVLVADLQGGARKNSRSWSLRVTRRQVWAIEAMLGSHSPLRRLGAAP
jgi:hypothetical protein